MTTLRLGDIVRGPGGRGLAVVYGVRLFGNGRLQALLHECRPKGARYGLTKRGTPGVDVLGRDIETAAMAWGCIAAEAWLVAAKARKPHAAEVYRRIATRARRNAVRIRRLVAEGSTS